MAFSASGSLGFSHLITTLASSTSLGTVFQLFPSFENQISKVEVSSRQPLAKLFHPYNQRLTLGDLFREHFFLYCLLYSDYDCGPIGEMCPFFQNDHIVFHNSFTRHCWISCKEQSDIVHLSADI